MSRTATVRSRSRGTWIDKLRQLARLVRESHAQPMAGERRQPETLEPGEMGVTFLGHSSFLVRVSGWNVLWIRYLRHG